jgi:hypothetical protein
VGGEQGFEDSQNLNTWINEGRYLIGFVAERLPGFRAGLAVSPISPENSSATMARSNWFWGLWTVVAAFGTYFCMYAFRKPFAAATYDDLYWAGITFKTVLVTSQKLSENQAFAFRFPARRSMRRIMLT